MRILHLYSSLSTGGIEAMIVGLSNTMSATEEVEIGLTYKPKPTDFFLKKLDSKIKVHDFGKTKPGLEPGLPFKILKFIQKNKYDVVHIHGYFFYYMLGILFYHKKIKFYYTVHNDAFLENTRWDRKILSIKKKFFKKGWLRPFTISDASQESFKKLYGECNDIKIFNGISTPKINEEVKASMSEYRLTPSTKLFINPGRIGEQKNQAVLAKVIDRLNREGHDIVLLMAGRIENHNVYAELEPYLCDRIVYLGERDEIPSMMAGCDALSLPSNWEGLPVVLLEALSVGCIPICSPVGGIKNVVTDGIDGILLSGSTEQDIYEGFLRFLKLSDDDLKALRENCRATFENYRIENTAAHYLEAYRN